MKLYERTLPRRKQESIDRSAKMAEMYLVQKMNYEQIGKVFNLTRERVRQLLVLQIGKDAIILEKERRKQVIKERNDNKFSPEKKQHIENFRLFKEGKRWSADYACCVQCGSTKRRSKGRGLCYQCYEKTPERIVSQKVSSKKYYLSHREERKGYNNKYAKKYWKNMKANDPEKYRMALDKATVRLRHKIATNPEFAKIYREKSKANAKRYYIKIRALQKEMRKTNPKYEHPTLKRIRLAQRKYAKEYYLKNKK